MEGIAERPKSKLPGGKINPEYTKWRADLLKQTGTKSVDEALAALEKGKPEPTPEPAPEGVVMDLRVISPARNRRFVLCSHEGRKVPVRIGSRVKPEKLLKKTIRVRIDAAGFTHLP